MGALIIYNTMFVTEKMSTSSHSLVEFGKTVMGLSLSTTKMGLLRGI